MAHCATHSLTPVLLSERFLREASEGSHKRKSFSALRGIRCSQHKGMRSQESSQDAQSVVATRDSIHKANYDPIVEMDKIQASGFGEPLPGSKENLKRYLEEEPTPIPDHVWELMIEGLPVEKRASAWADVERWKRQDAEKKEEKKSHDELTD